MIQFKRNLLQFKAFILKKKLSKSYPSEILAQIYNQASNPMISTSFGKYSEALLSLIPTNAPDIPVLWVNTGFHSESTSIFAKKMIKKYKLNIIEIKPEISILEFKKKYVTFPAYGTKENEKLCQTIKIKPFRDFLSSYRPDYWFTGIRKDETDYRSSLGICSVFASRILRIAPFIEYTDLKMRRYMLENKLEIVTDYFDPCRPENKECGIQTIESL